jgi:hypothetical protein
VNWTYVSTSPIVSPTPGAFDSYQVAYGRFLRDYAGRLVKVNGKYIWYYRGERPGNQYAIGAATSPDLQVWTKAGSAPLFNPLSSSLCSLGSALLINGKVFLILSAAPLYDRSNGNPGVMAVYLKQPNVAGDPFDWSDGPGVPIYQDPFSTVWTGGPSWVVDEGGRQYMAYEDFSNIVDQTGGHYEIHIADG